MKIRIVKKGLPKAQIGRELKTPNQVVLNGTTYLEGDPGYEEARQEVQRMKSQMGNLRDVNNTIQNLNSLDLKSAVPKIRTEVGNVVNNSIASSPKQQTFSPLGITNPQAFAANLQDIVTGNNPYASVLQDYNDKKLQEKFPTLGPTPREQELEKAGLAPQMSNLTAAPKPFDIGKAARTASTIGSGLLMAGSVVDYFGQNRKEKEFDRQFRRNQFDTEATSPMFRGNWNINTGTFRDDVTKQPNEGMFQMGGEENFTNVNNTMKIRITGRPQNLEFEYGGQSGYGFDLGQRRVQTEMPQSKSDSVRRTIPEVPRNKANIEAEAKESVYGDFDGDGGLEHMLIGGERHYNGGTPLNVPEGSFVFSDTPKMKIKDPEILKMFGKSFKTGGYTPAELARPYNINKYKAIIEDPNADEKDKSTAQLMVNNLNAKLSKLAMVQESMKGFPQGIPSVAKQGKDKEEMAMARYGGFLPEYQMAGPVLDPATIQYIKDQQLAKDTQRRQQASTTSTVPNRQIVEQTFSPKELANLDDPEYAKYQALLNKYDTKLTKGAINISSIAPEDAREFARLSGKFGFRRKDDQGKDVFRVIQSSTPGLTFTDSRGKKSGFFGGYTPKLYERRLVEDLLGADAVNNMSELDIRKAYFKELGIDTSNLSDEQLSDEKSLYSNKNFFEKEFYPKFSEKFVGADYRTQMGDDMMIGAEHFDSYREKPTEIIPGKTPDPGPDPERDPEPDPNKYTYGEKTPEGNVGFLTPDKLTLLNAGLTPPRAYYPFAPPLPFRKGTLALDDWRAQAQQRQGTFNTAASTLGQYQPGTALASNLSFLAGQTGEGVSQDIASVNSRNVDRANQFMSQEVQRQSFNDMFNAQRMQDLYDKGTITKQQYDNALRKYTSGITKAANNAFANRMYLDMTNKVNPMFNVDPRTGLSFFKDKQGYDTDQFRSGSYSGGVGNVDFGSLGKAYNDAKSKFPELTVAEFMRSTTGRTTMTDDNADGIPNNVRSNMPGVAMNLPAMYNQALRFNDSYLFGGQIGPWFNKKKKK
jgi:hypothetical protein